MVRKKLTTISDLDSAEKIGGIGNVRLNNGVLLTLTTLELLLLGLALRDKLYKNNQNISQLDVVWRE